MVLPLVVLLLLQLIAADDCRNSISAGSIAAVVNGEMLKLPVVQTGGTAQTQPHVDVEMNKTVLNHGARVYLGSECRDTFEDNMYYQFKLMDKTIKYTVDLSNVGCGCNAAFYLVSMPAYNSKNVTDPSTSKDYYCDANKVHKTSGFYCPEIDLFEANTHNIHITPHTCDAPTGKYYSNCDSPGYNVSAYDTNPNYYGPGLKYTVDTTKPFTLSHTFTSSASILSKITSVFTQGKKSFTLTHDKSDYLKGLTDAVKNGMVISISLWGGDADWMSWLDIPPCSRNINCDPKTSVPFSNIIVS